MFNVLLAMALFLSPGDPRLSEEADEVCPCKILSEEVQGEIEALFEAATPSLLVGLAAPQIGISKRIILVDMAATEVFTKDSLRPPPDLKEFINPEIVWQSEEQEEWCEDCFSTPHLSGVVPRSKKVVIRAYDRTGNLATQEYEGYLASIFQHEIDHLDGILLPDRMTKGSLP